jgi:hypothetical protein
MNSLGIYFGIKNINLVETSGNKILNNISLPHPKQEAFEVEDMVPAEVKIMALLKDAFRSNHINANEATFCISGQDLVIRTFEIPLLPQSELRGAISFEAKKYIPFKLDDLDYDFQVALNKKNKTSLVLFVGMKKVILANYVSFAKQLNLKINALEYSAFSVLRFLKLSGLNTNGVIVSLCFDSNNEDEANFTVFENGFSLFSRDFDFTGRAPGFEEVSEADLIQQQEKLKKEIRTSFDYYNRKFPDKVVKNIFVISDKGSHQGLKSFFAETAIPVKFVDTQKLLGRNNNYSSVLVKSYAAALFKTAPLKININLISSRLKIARSAAAGPLALFEGIKVDLRYVFLGIVVCIAVFGYGLIRTQTTQQELDRIMDSRIKIKSVSAEANLDALSNLSSKYKKKIAALDKIVKNQRYITPLLSTIPKALPKGVWLESFNLVQGKNMSMELSLNGQAYYENGEKEFEAVNIFLANLKNDPQFSSHFKDIAIGFIDRKDVQGKSVAVFKIECK